MLRSVLACVLLACLALSAATPASSQSLAEFYKANRITILVGADAGGGYDAYGRLLARHLGRHIPGTPNIIVQNMPSVASINATNYLVNIAPRDGTMIAHVQRELAMVQIVGNPAAKFKAVELIWLGSLLSEPGVCGIATRTGIASFADVFRREFIMGSSGPAAVEHYPSMFNNLLGAKLRLVKGYKSMNDIGLAIERGEVAGMCQGWATFKQQHETALKAGAIRPLVQVALKPHPEMTALGVPMFTEFVTPERIAPGLTRQEVIDTFNFQLSSTIMGRPFVLAPGVPADRVAALVRAFEAVVKDSEFLADAAKSKRDIEFVSGKEIGDMINQIARLPRAKLEKMDEALKN